MSNKKTIILSIPDNFEANDAFEGFKEYCVLKNIMLRCEPYDSDIFNELNVKALDIERNHTLTELEDEILNNVACIGGSCED